jgi:uncharacterized protein YggE
MKKNHIVLVTIIAIAALVSGCGVLPNASAANNQPHTLNVNGSGTVSVVPDIARVNIGVTTQNADAATALDVNTQDVNGVMQTLIEQGVAEEDIQTSNFSIYQQQQYPTVGMNMGVTEEDQVSEPQTVFVVQNTVLVIVRDLDSLGGILASVVEQGANTINSISFDLEDKDAAIAEATQMAIDDAASQAQEIADAAGVELGAINFLSTSSNGSIAPRAAVMDQAAAGNVPISSGTLSIQVTANVTYEFN